MSPKIGPRFALIPLAMNLLHTITEIEHKNAKALLTIHFEGGNLQYTMLNIPKIIQEANMGVIYMKEVPRMCDKCYYKKKRTTCMPSVRRRYMYAKCDESGR